ncbi:MAG: tRNA (uridine(34)/cytosine(34)/5-carboxymethylaminomethyluridine(34)-2'-O)-methyltransferase TrmL [Xanthomonadales bacterium]|nr:tRNA (uridine(34)/cytosine(34)/5-carboxymethylaminomethyluridine(34)-2'-O)-methyltransferase TrmL [Xanthomonadales bacterium]
MLNIILYQPEIPPNTGNIIRLCANTGAKLHLIHPLGFNLSDKQMRRAGLDYHEYASIEEYSGWEDFRQRQPEMRLMAFSTHGKLKHTEIQFADGDGLLFGPETRGLPETIRDSVGIEVVRLPMVAGSRSLNLSNTVAVALYEAWRQLDFQEYPAED